MYGGYHTNGAIIKEIRVHFRLLRCLPVPNEQKTYNIDQLGQFRFIVIYLGELPTRIILEAIDYFSNSTMAYWFSFKYKLRLSVFVNQYAIVKVKNDR